MANQKTNQIGDHYPIVGGTSTQFNGGMGHGANDPFKTGGSKNPGNTKPPRPESRPSPNAMSGAKK